MGQCGSTIAASPATLLRDKGTGASGKPVFHLDIDASAKAVDALAAAGTAACAGQPSSPVISARLSSRREAQAAPAGSGTRALRLSLPQEVLASALASSSSSDGGSEASGPPSSAGSRTASGASMLSAALSTQPALPASRPLPQRRVRFNYSPVKSTHRYEVPDEEPDEPAPVQAAKGEALKQAAAAAAAALERCRAAAAAAAAAASRASSSSSFSSGCPSPMRSALSAELAARQRLPGSGTAGMLGGGGGLPSPTRAAALSAVPMAALLHSVASLSRAGKEPTYRKQNQDNCFAFSQYCRPNQALLAALDGHGPHGHLVSSFLKRQLPVMLADRLGESSAASAASCAACDASFTSASSAASTAASGCTATSSKGPCCEAAAAAAGRDPAAALTATFLAADAALGQEPGMNVQYSGSTAVLCMLRGRRLTTAWVGDSRAVLARQDPRGMRAVPLTRDHKPGNTDERARIAASGGRVERLVDQRGLPVGPDRVWLSTSWVPGLAMSRALGDAVAHTVGVSSEPETSVVELCPQDRFLILATDGVWEFIDPQGAVDIVAGCRDAEEACRALVDTAWSRWLAEEGGVVDDITVVVAKLNP
ncbi:hypothetical protein ABPG77_002903 [Micractinium sp. CCAP 211/92]